MVKSRVFRQLSRGYGIEMRQFCYRMGYNLLEKWPVYNPP